LSLVSFLIPDPISTWVNNCLGIFFNRQKLVWGHGRGRLHGGGAAV